MVSGKDAPRNLTCPREDCRKQLKTPTGWALHVRVCTGKGALYCNKPGCKRKAGFASRTDLNRHIESKHGDGSRRYTCPEPGCHNRGFLRHNFLVQHMQRHRGERQQAHLCDECKRTNANPPMYALRRFRPLRYCGKHAAEKLGARRVVTSSIAACRCFDLLEKLNVFGPGVKLHHVHFDPHNATCEGKEVDYLVPGQRWRPDAWDPVHRIWVDFLGNEYHGYPPGENGEKLHKKERNYYGELYTELYERTMARLRYARDCGPSKVQVYYVWEHEWKKAKTLAEVYRAVHSV